MDLGDKKARKTVEQFAAAALIFAAKLALYLDIDKRSFLRSAAVAWSLAEQGKSRVVDGSESVG